MKATITVGISASGKTTWAREHAQETGAIITNRDDLRFSLTGAKDWSQYKFKKQTEGLITTIQKGIAAEAFEMGKEIIIADTNLNPATRHGWVEYLIGLGYCPHVKPFPITLEEALRRDSLRANGVGKDIIYRQWKDWLKFSCRKVYEPDETKQKAVMFDIDGTLAHMVDRSPYAWDSVGSDTLDEHVSMMLQAYVQAGYHIIFASGRDGSCYDQTETWILRHLGHILYPINGASWTLLLREAGDIRKDTLVKEEIFWRDIEPKYNVKAVFDDRPSVVRMWNDLGIPKVIAVADQNNEF